MSRPKDLKNHGSPENKMQVHHETKGEPIEENFLEVSEPTVEDIPYDDVYEATEYNEDDHNIEFIKDLKTEGL